MNTTNNLAEALRLGQEGAPATENERLLFEEWMRGHCWALCATWNGKQYVSDAERDGHGVDPRAMNTRQLFAAWRDRAALAALEAEAKAGNAEPDRCREALEHIAITLERQIELIGDRAPGEWLGKVPVLRTMRNHARRARKALAAAEASDDQARDRNAERLTKEAFGLGGGINPDATSVDDLFADCATPAAPAPLTDAELDALMPEEVLGGYTFANGAVVAPVWTQSQVHKAMRAAIAASKGGAV